MVTLSGEKVRRAAVSFDLARPPLPVLQRLLIISPEGGSLVDATVESSAGDAPLTSPPQHKLRLQDGRSVSIDLNPFNHCVQVSTAIWEGPIPRL